MVAQVKSDGFSSGQQPRSYKVQLFGSSGFCVDNLLMPDEAKALTEARRWRDRGNGRYALVFQKGSMTELLAEVR